MGKILKATFEKNCIGCELCVVEAQKQLKKIGLEGSPIRVFRGRNEKGNVYFKLDIDLSVKDLNIEKIEKICPSLVFTLEESSMEEHELVK